MEEIKKLMKEGIEEGREKKEKKAGNGKGKRIVEGKEGRSEIWKKIIEGREEKRRKRQRRKKGRNEGMNKIMKE